MSDYLDSGKRGYDSLDLRPNKEVNWGPIKIEDIGTSTPPMKDQLQSLKARIFQGTKKVELGFWGKGKGSMGQGSTTPGMLGKDERQDIKELADYNKVELSTHVSPAISNLSGFTDRGFNEQARAQALSEIKRTIDFAKDTTKGGAVVVHTGEFPRPFADAEWNRNGDGKFEMYESEKEKAQQYAVDKRTGEIIVSFSRDQVVAEPVFLNAKDVKKEFGIDVIGKYSEKKKGKITKEDYVDLDGNYLDTNDTTDLFKRIPSWDGKDLKFNAVTRDWKYFDKKAVEWNETHKEKKTPAQIFAETQLDNQILQQKGSSLFHAMDYDNVKANLLRGREVQKNLETSWKHMTPSQQKEQMRDKLFGNTQEQVKLLGSESKAPHEIVGDFIKSNQNRLVYIHEASSAADAQAVQTLEKRKAVTSLEGYAQKKTYDTIAKAAQEAMAKSKKLEKPLYIAPENIFPEQYGAHPQELKEIIINSRKEFVKNLVNEGEYSKEEAKKKARTHIKATFDMGHVYTWRKYFTKGDKEFDKWVLKEVDKLGKAGVIGHVHVSDNFGYEDEHVTPGQGNVPIRKILEKLKKYGHTDVIVEAAHQDYKAMLGGWSEFGGPIYGMEGGPLSWSNVENSYFGASAPPYFIYGDQAPNPQEWQLWSQTRLE
jgi:sugar phosphate isomerase/epimerase